MKKGQKFILKSFNGEMQSTNDCSENENYWKLIGSTGTLLNLPQELNFPSKERVLIQFDIDVNELKLECHNEKPNSLWILKSDLQMFNK